MAKKPPISEEEAKLPPEIHVNSGIIPRTINWPKDLYDQYYAIAQRLGNSMSKITIALVRNFVNENKHLLE